jgi:hypothetical protein
LIAEVVAGEGPASQASRIGFPCVVEAALELGRFGEAASLLTLLADRPPGHVPPFLRAQVARGRGLLAAAEDDAAGAEAHFAAAIETLAALAYPYWLGRVRTDLATVLIEQGRAEEARLVLDQAVASLRELAAAPALRRAEALLARLPVPASRL